MSAGIHIQTANEATTWLRKNATIQKRKYNKKINKIENEHENYVYKQRKRVKTVVQMRERGDFSVK